MECSGYKNGGPPCPSHGVGGIASKELLLLAQIDRFGVKAVLGRDVLYCGEIRRMTVAENIKIAFESRRGWKGGWDDWTAKNKDLANLLFEAERLCE